MLTRKKIVKFRVAEGPVIKIIKNGPYLVSGKVPLAKQIIVTNEEGYSLKWKEGQKYSTEGSCLLCRCGYSKNMPYCDRSHLEINFDGTEVASSEPYKKQAEEFEGPEVILGDVLKLCADARFCDRAGNTWNLVQKSKNQKAKKTAIQQIFDCPSGRLVIRDKKTGKPIEPHFSPSIGVVEDPHNKVSGPLWIRGGIPIESSDGKKYEIRNRVTLCRCGCSKNKPFCDGSHIRIRFNDEDEGLK